MCVLTVCIHESYNQLKSHNKVQPLSDYHFFSGDRITARKDYFTHVIPKIPLTPASKNHESRIVDSGVYFLLWVLLDQQKYSEKSE